MTALLAGARFAEWSRTPPVHVAVDVDGTLVGHDGTISAGVVAAVRRAVDAGLTVGLATGRMSLGVTDLLAAAPLTGPHVFSNGAEVRDGTGAVVAARPVPSPVLARLLDAATSTSTYLEVYVDGGYLVTAEDERARPHWDLLGHGPRGVVRTLDDLDGPATKVTAAVFDPDDVPRVVGMLRDAGLLAGPAGSPATPGLTYVNGTDPAADKGAALRSVAGHLGADVAAVAAVGDAANDLPLLRAAGTAVAMGQAEAEVRATAHLLAPSVDDDGLAVALDAAVAGWQEGAP